jgi:hypothetical protein
MRVAPAPAHATGLPRSECRRCVGFRLGLAGGIYGSAVGPPDGVPFVPLWMSAVAAELTSILREAHSGALDGLGCVAVEPPVLSSAAPDLRDGPAVQGPPGFEGTHTALLFSSLMLRGSRSGAAVAVLTLSTPASVGEAVGTADGAVPQPVVEETPLANAELARRLGAAALSAGVRLCSVAVRHAAHSGLTELLPGGTAGVVEECIHVEAATACEPPARAGGGAAAAEPGSSNTFQRAQAVGAAAERLPSEAGGGVRMLRLRVSPAAFFQVNTASAELLYATIARAARMVVPAPQAACASDQSGQAAIGDGRGPGGFAALVIDACCGGGAIGLWIAHQVRAGLWLAAAPWVETRGVQGAKPGKGREV